MEGYALYLSDNQRIRIHGQGIELHEAKSIVSFPVEMQLHELSDDVLNILLALARAGNLAMTDGLDENVIVVGVHDDQRVRTRWPDARSIETTDQLRDWLEEAAAYG